jgi:hypothetical protein
MRTLKLRFPNDALPILNTFLKQTKEVWGFRRAQSVHAPGDRAKSRAR